MNCITMRAHSRDIKERERERERGIYLPSKNDGVFAVHL